MFGRSQVLMAFDEANDSIGARSNATTTRIANEGVKHLRRIADEFFKAYQLNKTAVFPEISETDLEGSSDTFILANKELIFEVEVDSTVSPSRHYSFGHTERKEHKGNSEQLDTVE